MTGRTPGQKVDARTSSDQNLALTFVTKRIVGLGVDDLAVWEVVAGAVDVVLDRIQVVEVALRRLDGGPMLWGYVCSVLIPWANASVEGSAPGVSAMENPVYTQVSAP